jgi:hypothetical protein
MFVTIRRYSPKNGAITKASLDLLRRQIQADFLPVIQEVPGFHSYYVLNVENRELLTLCFCDTQQGSAEFNRCAADYTLRNPLVFELGRPEMIEAQVLTSAEVRSGPGEESHASGDAAAAALALWFQESRSMLLTASEQ